MIPKIIHYCWFGGKEIPDGVKNNIDTWRTLMPDYEIRQWDESSFDVNAILWTKQAYAERKYAFVADFVRIYALYKYGGLYFDTDVEVLKSFEDLMNLPYFIGQENTPSGIESATMGFEKGHQLLFLMLNYYKDRPFKKNDGKNDIVPIPFIIRECIETQFKYYKINNIEEFQYNSEIINVFPVDWFSPKTWDTKELNVTNNTYSIHHFAGSWLDNKENNEIAYEETKNPNSIKGKQNVIKDVIIFLFKKMLINKNVVFLSNTTFIDAFCGFYDLKNGNPLREFYVDKNDLLLLIKYLNLHKQIRYNFIRINDSNNPQKYTHFYPIAKIIGTEIELHFFNFSSKQQASDFISEFNASLKNRKIILFFEEPSHWNMLDIIAYCWKVNCM